MVTMVNDSRIFSNHQKEAREMLCTSTSLKKLVIFLENICVRVCLGFHGFHYGCFQENAQTFERSFFEIPL